MKGITLFLACLCTGTLAAPLDPTPEMAEADAAIAKAPLNTARSIDELMSILDSLSESPVEEYKAEDLRRLRDSSIEKLALAAHYYIVEKAKANPAIRIDKLHVRTSSSVYFFVPCQSIMSIFGPYSDKLEPFLNESSLQKWLWVARVGICRTLIDNREKILKGINDSEAVRKSNLKTSSS